MKWNKGSKISAKQHIRTLIHTKLCKSYSIETQGMTSCIEMLKDRFRSQWLWVPWVKLSHLDIAAIKTTSSSTNESTNGIAISVSMRRKRILSAVLVSRCVVLSKYFMMKKSSIQLATKLLTLDQSFNMLYFIPLDPIENLLKLVEC